MKNIIIFLTIVLSAFACEKKENPSPLSLDYLSGFATEPRPISIAANRANGNVFVANFKPSSNEYSAKIQKFSKEGELLKSTVDFTSFDKGNYFRYMPIDITIDDNQNLYVLVQPLIEQTEETWITPTGFSILSFDINDNFNKEFDFSHIDGEGRPSSITYLENFIFVTDGRNIKKISIETQQVIDIVIPITLDNNTTWPDLHTTDMEINSDGLIYFTGQAAINNDSVGCHITLFNSQTNQLINTLSESWTSFYGAMLNNPGLSIHSNGNLYLATFYCMSIEVYNKNMDFMLREDIRTIDGEDTRPIDVTIYNNNIYVADNLNNQIHVYTED